MTVAKGLDGAIINPMYKKLMANIVAAEALSRRDEYCANFLEGFRNKIIEM